MASPTPPPTQIQTLLLSSLLRLSREISLFENPSPLQKRNFSSVARKSKLLSVLFEELLRFGCPELNLPRSAVLCFREILVVLQRFKSFLADCSTRSRIRLLLQSESVSADFHELTSDLSTLLDILPDLDLADDVNDLIALLRRHCRNSSPAIDPSEEDLRNEILSLISDVEKEIVPDWSRLEAIFRRLGLEDSRSCRAEVEILEREIGDRVSEKWASAMIASVGLVRYAKCVLFGASTPRPESDTSSKIDFPTAGTTTEIAVPADFRCPISLDLMRDPVVVATGQTYDRESITRWIASGHATCPKTGQPLSHTNLVPNKALRSLISAWCREENIPFDATESNGEGESKAVTSNKAAMEAARMTASFLVGALATSAQPEAANRVVHELRQLARSGSDNIRVFIGDAGAVPLLVPLLSSSDANLQVNAVTALLNLSILEANKKRVMHADGAIDGVIRVMSSGATWRARENAAAAILSLSAVHSYRRRLGRDRRILDELVNLANVGPASTKKDALDAIVCLAGDRENIRRVVESGVIEAALDAIDMTDVAEEAVAVLSAIAKRGGAQELGEKEGSVSKLVRVLKNGSDSARENAASALVYLCRKAVGGKVVSELAGVPGIEWVIWDMMGSGTERGRRKASALGRICRRWASEEADRIAAMYSDVSLTATATMTIAQS